MRMVEANLEYEGQRYTITQEYQDSSDDGNIIYHWTEGNYSCDCNRLTFLANEHELDVPVDPNDEYGFPPCGEGAVKLLSLLVDGRLLDIW